MENHQFGDAGGSCDSELVIDHELQFEREHT